MPAWASRAVLPCAVPCPRWHRRRGRVLSPLGRGFELGVEQCEPRASSLRGRCFSARGSCKRGHPAGRPGRSRDGARCRAQPPPRLTLLEPLQSPRKGWPGGFGAAPELGSVVLGLCAWRDRLGKLPLGGKPFGSVRSCSKFLFIRGLSVICRQQGGGGVSGGHVKGLSLVVGLGTAQELLGISLLLLQVPSLSPQSPVKQTLTRQKKKSLRAGSVQFSPQIKHQYICLYSGVYLE